MNVDRALELMRIERECIMRAEYCDRNCRECVLVQDAEELKDAFDYVIKMLEE